MLCEKYQGTLIELTISGAELGGDVRAHLEACASCAALVRRERLLFASMESGLRRIANTEVPESLLPHVRARLAEETCAAGAGSLTWIGGLAAAAILVVIVLPFLWPRDVQEAVNSPDTKPLAAKREDGSTPQRPKIAPRAVSRIPRYHVNGAALVAAKNEPEVLIPPDEREAFAHFVVSVQERKELAVALVSPAPERKTEPLNVEPLQIARLEMKSLEEEGSVVDVQSPAE